MFGFGKKKKQDNSLTLTAPFEGRVINLSEVADPAFAGGMLGKGFAVALDDAPETLEVCAPAAGTVTQVFKTGHAFVIHTEDELDILVHIGFDTVQLKGDGFEALAQKKDTVTAGQPIIRVEAARLKAQGVDLSTPVVFPDSGRIEEVTPTSTGATVTLG